MRVRSDGQAADGEGEQGVGAEAGHEVRVALADNERGAPVEGDGDGDTGRADGGRQDLGADHPGDGAGAHGERTHAKSHEDDGGPVPAEREADAGEDQERHPWSRSR